MSLPGTSKKDSAAVKLIKCFCGCSDMTRDEVKRITLLANSVHNTLLDPEASKLLRRFLEQDRFGDDKNETEQYLDIYEKCTEFLQENQRTLAKDEIEELCDLGLPYDLETDLTRRMLSGQQSDFKHGLNRIQRRCCNEIESMPHFEQFKNALIAKLKREPK